MKFYYAARSDVMLMKVCRRLEAAYGFMPFLMDTEDNWEYGVTGFGEIKEIAVTKADDYKTVETWRPDCPSGVNYHVVVKADNEPPDLLARLEEFLGVKVVKYLETEDEPDRTGC
jgi:hypothetical protein